ncbi:MAG: helix-turn-helix domain-containing protein, partial [Bacillota bacterium]|nr:helix-turn-helix domain-containing protein [Bacillota bacterium]
MKRGYMDQSAVRIFNQTQMVNMIREDDQLTTARIARRMGLSPPAVSNNIAELIERGVIVKAGQQKRPKEPGRKGELLAVNPVYSHIIAADLSGRRLIAGACDFSNKVLLTKIGDAIVGKEAGNILNQIIKIVDAIILETRLSAEQLGAIVISAPGNNDPETGTNILAPHFTNRENTKHRKSHREHNTPEKK